ncbi:MAG: hypothetical protein IPK19_23625 [Chloroflexi bacterium]|nr:hypothetical protein [Chloroflexota bacterium]
MRRLAARMLCLVLALVCLLPGVGIAQDLSSCPTAVQSALAQAQSSCGATARNEVCYGHDALQAQPAALLQAPGDIAPVAQLQTLQLSPVNAETGQWGVALARLQVNLPDTLPGENVTFVLYGDVTFEPVHQASQPVISAFRMSSGIGGVRCGSTDMNGLIVQSPSTGQKVSFMLNGVEVRMGSTVQFLAQPGGQMTVRTLAGAAVLSAGGLRSVATAGTQVTVPLDDNLEPSGPPEFPTAYDVEELWALPIGLLDEEVDIAEPLSDEALEFLWGLIEADEFGELNLDDWLDSDDYDAFMDDFGDDSDGDLSDDEFSDDEESDKQGDDDLGDTESSGEEGGDDFAEDDSGGDDGGEGG